MAYILLYYLKHQLEKVEMQRLIQRERRSAKNNVIIDSKGTAVSLGGEKVSDHSFKYSFFWGMFDMF